MSGLTGTQTELLYALTAPVTKNTYTTQAVFGPLAASAPVPRIPGGFFQENPNPIGRSLYLKAMGSIATTSAATFAPVLSLDTTPGAILATWQSAIYAATAPTAAVTAQWNLDVWFTCTAFGEAAGMTWQVNGSWTQSSVATGGVLTATTATGFDAAQIAATWTGLTPATTYYPELLGTWSASASGNTTTLQQMFLWGLN
jgi:hypothetical protein